MDAPTVLAIVFRQSMAEIGRSGFCFSLLSLEEPFTPCSSSPVIYDKGVERSVASSVEQSPEITIDNTIITYINCSSIISIYEGQLLRFHKP